ncbi:MAG: N-acetyltransferase family protein [Roseburia sp.]
MLFLKKMVAIMIRRAERRDIPALMDIYNDAILHTTATFDTEIKDRANREAWYGEHTGRYAIFVCEEGKEIVGYASLSRYRDRRAFDPAVELSIYLREDARGRGIGRELMAQILASARACEEIATVISLITGDNEASIRLHEHFGFVYCGQIRSAGVKFGRTLNLNAYQIVFDR